MGKRRLVALPERDLPRPALRCVGVWKHRFQGLPDRVSDQRAVHQHSIPDTGARVALCLRVSGQEKVPTVFLIFELLRNKHSAKTLKVQIRRLPVMHGRYQ